MSRVKSLHSIWIASPVKFWIWISRAVVIVPTCHSFDGHHGKIEDSFNRVIPWNHAPEAGQKGTLSSPYASKKCIGRRSLRNRDMGVLDKVSWLCQDRYRQMNREKKFQKKIFFRYLTEAYPLQRFQFKFQHNLLVLTLYIDSGKVRYWKSESNK